MKTSEIINQYFQSKEYDPAVDTKLDDLGLKILVKTKNVSNQPTTIETVPHKRESYFLKPQYLFAILSLMLLIGGAYYLYQQKPWLKQLPPIALVAPAETKSTPTSSQVQTTPVITPNTTKLVQINLASGFTFSIPPNWSAKISDQSKDHFYGRFFISNNNNETTYLDVETIAAIQYQPNPFIKSEKTSSKVVNGLKVAITEGTESFFSSTRQIKQAVINNNDKILVATLYEQSSDKLTNEFDIFVNTVSFKSLSNGQTLIRTIFAAESIAGFDSSKFTRIDVMGDPLPERITKNDIVYKDGLAKTYQFQAFKGQRLTTVAMEDRSINQNSFIRSELYDKEGTSLFNRDTRIEFEAPYTGIYYWIVRSFNKQEGGYLLKVFDRNQTDNLIYLKYADGSEKLLDPTKSPPQYGAKEVALIFQFISPVEIINDSTVRYFSKPKEFEAGLGLITTPLQVYIKQQTYQDLFKQGIELPEDNQQNLQSTKLTRLSPSRVLIGMSTGELFPTNRHIVIVEKSIGRYRFYTENPVSQIN